jgi:FkbH-like protein
MNVPAFELRSPLLFDVVEALRETNARDAAGQWSGSIKIKIFRNYAAEFIEPFLKYYFSQIGIRCELSFGGYNTIHHELLEAEDLRSYDLIVMSFIPEEPAASSAKSLLEQVTTAADLVLDKAGVPVVLNTFIRPLLDSGGIAYALRNTSLSSRIVHVNHALHAYAAERMPRCLLVDWERLVMLVGLDAAIDRRMGYVAVAPFRHAFLSAYAHEIFKVGRALKGAGKKCLILDCDDTLWGGTVGEVGIEGIELGTEYPGKAFHDFQNAVVRLAEQGVMVALCSKNNLADVMEVLDNHPHCALRRRHLVSYRISWGDKERNIQAIVDELNIGMDAVVFIDDNPVECQRMRVLLPGLTVRAVPKQLSELPLLLDREGFFEKLAVTDEDRKRAQLYQAEAKRREATVNFANVEEFLASLQLKARIEIASEHKIARISQLTQRTNQFNVTVRRYSESEIARMMSSRDYAVFTLTASDRFGELGLIGVFIARHLDDKSAIVDTLLMSCRALGRRLEGEFVTCCIEDLDRRWNPSRWEAEYVRGRKNEQVAAFWSNFGFTEEAKEPGRVRYGAERAQLRLDHVPYIAVEIA